MAAPKLQLIAHTAGTVKLLARTGRACRNHSRRGATVYSGSTAIAINVAETTIGFRIVAMRRWPESARAFPTQRKPGITQPGDSPVRNGQYLTGATVGIVGLSSVARHTLPLLKPFGCKVLVYDPYVSQFEADRLEVELTDLR